MRYTSIIIFSFITWMVVLNSVAAYADTHWANLNGTNQPPYTSYATGAHEIQDAIDAAMAGDTVRITAGLYRPDTTICLRDSIAIIGSGQDSTVIFPRNCNSHNIIGIFGPSGGAGGGIRFEYCTIRGYESHNYPCHVGIAIHLKNSTTNYISHNSFHFCDVAVELAYADAIVADNYFDSNDVAIRLDFGGPFDIHDNTIIGWPLGYGAPSEKGISNLMILLGPAKIHHNKIFLHRGTGIGFTNIGDSLQIYNNLIVSGGSLIFGVYCDCDGALIQNNTIIRSSIDPKWVLAGFTPAPGSEIIVENNSFMGLDGVVEIYDLEYGNGSIRLAYNDFWGLDSGSSGIPALKYPAGIDLDTIGNIYRNPMFTDDSLFYLQRGSPLIDKGNPAIQDIDGTRSDIGWAGGPGGVTYTYAEEPPQKPDTLIGELNTDTVYLSWSANSEADLSGYQLYRDTFAGFDPSVENLLASISSPDTAYKDSIAGIPGDLYYMLTALDTTGLESPPSNEIAVKSTGILEEKEPSGILPLSPCILGAYPNPFNISTVVEISISAVGASPAPALINIYDILGRKVSTAFDGTLEYGIHRIEWDARSYDGHSLASGIYFARLSVWGNVFGPSVKLVLQK